MSADPSVKKKKRLPMVLFAVFLALCLLLAVEYVSLRSVERGDAADTAAIYISEAKTLLHIGVPLNEMETAGGTVVALLGEGNMVISCTDPYLVGTHVDLPASQSGAELNGKFTSYAVYEGFTIAVIQDADRVYGDSAVTLSVVSIYLLIAAAVVGFIVYRSISELVNEQKLAATDGITGLNNRRAYEDALRSLQEDSRRTKLTYVSLDLNGLKAANDRLGHEAGDELIRGTARFMKECFGQYGRLFRTGGDEFVALLFLSENEFGNAKLRFDEGTKLWTQRHGLDLSVSIGAARADEFPDLTLTELAKKADDRMYRAKAKYYADTGKDRRKH